MRRLAATLLLISGCASPASPPSAADQESLQARLRSALDSPYAVGRFYAEYEADGRVLMKCRGTARAFRSGIVQVEEEAATGTPLRLLRVGDRAWIHRDGWKDAAGTEWETLGTGFQSPYEVLQALETAAEKFAAHRQGGIVCPGDRRMLDPVACRARSHPPEDVPIEGVLKAGFRDGPLITRFSAEIGTSTVWIAKMDIVSWGPAPPMRFDDIPAPFTPDMKAAVRKATEGR